MRLNWLSLKLSIKLLLGVLVGVATLSIIIMGVTAGFSTKRIADNQENLINVSTIQAASAGMNIALTGFVGRQLEITSSDDAGVLQSLSNRGQYEEIFGKNFKTLGDYSKVYADIGPHITDLDSLYKRMLVADNDFYNQKVELVNLLNTIEGHVAMVDDLVEKIQNAAEAISGKVAFSIKRGKRKIKKILRDEEALYKDRKKMENFHELAEKAILGKEAIHQKYSDTIRVGVLKLASLTRQLTKGQTPDELISIKENQAAQIIQETSHAITTLIEEFSSLPDLLSLVRQLQDKFNKIKSMVFEGDGSMYALRMDILKRTGSLEQSLATLRSIVPGVELQLNEISKRAYEEREIAIENSDVVLRTSRSLIIVMIILATVGMIILGIVIARMIIKPISKVISAMQDIAEGEGDLTQRLEGKGVVEATQLAQGFNMFVQKIQALISELATSMQHFIVTVNQTTEIAERTDISISSQKEEVHAIAQAIDGIAQTVDEVAKHAVNAASAADQANSEADNGKQVVNDAIQAIELLASNVNAGAETLHSLSSDAQNVGSVLEVIQGIAEQTNLLALNAAIEAARAGEQGRGFAVVADEVRTLASRTQESTEEIREIVESLQKSAKEAERVMMEGNVQAGKSVEQANIAGLALNGITDAVSSINDLNMLIASATEEQSSTAQAINDNVSTILKVSDETAGGSKQVASSNEKLSQMAHQIQKLIQQFKV